MKRSLAVVFVSGLITLILANCGKSSGTGGTGSTIVAGTWTAACSSSGRDADGRSSNDQVVAFTFDAAGNYTATYKIYETTNNTCGTQAATIVGSGTYNFGAAITRAKYKIDFTQTSQIGTPTTGGAAWLNTHGSAGGSICTGITFQDGVGVSLAGANCGGTRTHGQRTNGSTLFNTVQVTGNQLQLGIADGLGDHGTGAGSGDSDADRPTGLSTTVFVNPSAATVLEGTWKSSCFTETRNSDKISTYAFSKNSVDFTQQNFTTSIGTCGTLQVTVEVKGTFVLGSTVSVTSGGGSVNATKLDFTQTSSTATPAAGQANNLNHACDTGTHSICQKPLGTDVVFSEGTTTDISGAVCGCDLTTPNQTNGSTWYNVSFLPTATTLKFGQKNMQQNPGSGPGSADGNRPTGLDDTASHIFTKQ